MPTLCVGLTYLVLQAVRGPQDVDNVESTFFVPVRLLVKSNDKQRLKIKACMIGNYNLLIALAVRVPLGEVLA